LRVAAHQPQILRSDDDANRVIVLLLPQGECLQEHQVHEHALVFLVRGKLLVSAGASERTLSAPSLIHFDPGESHEVRAISECQLVLCLAPWPGPGHPSQPRRSTSNWSVCADSLLERASPARRWWYKPPVVVKYIRKGDPDEA